MQFVDHRQPTIDVAWPYERQAVFLRPNAEPTAGSGSVRGRIGALSMTRFCVLRFRPPDGWLFAHPEARQSVFESGHDLSFRTCPAVDRLCGLQQPLSARMPAPVVRRVRTNPPLSWPHGDTPRRPAGGLGRHHSKHRSAACPILGVTACREGHRDYSRLVARASGEFTPASMTFPSLLVEACVDKANGWPG